MNGIAPLQLRGNSMDKKRPLGIFSWFGFFIPLPERLELIKKAGFEATSLWWEDEEYPRRIPKAEMVAMVRDWGLVLDNIHAPFTDLNQLWSSNRYARQKIVDLHRQMLEDCARFNIPVMVMHVVEGEEPPAPNYAGIKSMERLVLTAEEFGVKIAVENTRRADSLCLVLREIPSSQLGFCYDSSHANLMPPWRTAFLAEFGPRLLATHLSDNDGQGDRHWLPGQGEIDWQELGRHFPSTYQGCLSLEVVATEEEKKEDPAVFLRRAWQSISWLDELWRGEEER